VKKIFLILFIFFLYHPLARSQAYILPCKEKDVVKDNCHGSIEYKENKNIITYVGNFKDNKPHGKGVHTYYITGADYPFGVIDYEGTSYFGTFNGKFKITFQDKSYDIANFKLNQLHGKSFSYDKFGSLFAEQTFENGIKRSEILFYNGLPVLKTESIFDSREKFIETKYYYRDGRILSSKDGHKPEISNLVKPKKEPIRQTVLPNQNVSEGNSINKTLQKIINK
jgi:hypothetical protein